MAFPQITASTSADASTTVNAIRQIRNAIETLRSQLRLMESMSAAEFTAVYGTQAADQQAVKDKITGALVIADNVNADALTGLEPRLYQLAYQTA